MAPSEENEHLQAAVRDLRGSASRLRGSADRCADEVRALIDSGYLDPVAVRAEIRAADRRARRARRARWRSWAATFLARTFRRD